MYDFSHFKSKVQEIGNWLKKELASIQTGRATVAFLDDIRVESYGTQMPINQVAGMSVEDARTIRIAPWDKTQVQAIERAITTANLGVSAITDDAGIRVLFPELTTETRQKYAKMVGQKLEEARVSVRRERDEVWTAIQNQEKDSTISEDAKFKSKEQMEKLVKEANDMLDTMATRREDEIMGK